MTPKLALYFKEYLEDQQALFQSLGRRHTADDLVFSVAGKPVDPNMLSHAFTRLARKSGLEGVRFHDLRHTFASLMLLLGAKPKVISEALGHASVAFTMDTYSHIISGMQEEAMALLDGALPAGVSRRNNANLTPTF
jgi:integrase